MNPSLLCLFLVALPGQVPEKTDTRGTLPAGVVRQLGTAPPHYLGRHVNTAKLSPDGELLAVDTLTGVMANPVVFVGVGSGKILRKKSSELVSGHRLTFSPDGRWMASTGGGSSVALVDLKNDEKFRSLLVTLGDLPFSTHFSADGRLMAVGANNPNGRDSILVYETETGKRLRRFEILQSGYAKAALSPDGKLVASWGGGYPENGKEPESSRIIQLWDISTGKELRRFQTNQERIQAAAFSPDGRKLVAVAHPDGIEVWDVATGKHLRRLKYDPRGGSDLKFSPDGKYLAVTGWRLQLWDAAAGKVLRQVGGPHLKMTDVAFPAKDKVLVGGCTGPYVYTWDVLKEAEPHLPRGHKNLLRAVSFVARDRVLSADVSGVICEWNTKTGKQVRRWELNALRKLDYPANYAWMMLAPDGKTLAAIEENSAVMELWDLRAGKRLREEKLNKSSFDGRPFDVSPDCKWLALVSGRFQAVELRSLTGDPVQRLFPLPKLGPRLYRSFPGFAFSRDGKYLAASWNYDSSNGDGFGVVGEFGTELLVWETKTGNQLWHKKLPMRTCASMDFSPDGTSLVLQGSWLENDKHANGLHVFDTVAGLKVSHMEGLPRCFGPLKFSPDGRTIAAVSWSPDHQYWHEMLCIWEVASGKIRWQTEAHLGPNNYLSFSPDGKLLATAGQDIPIYLRDMTGRFHADAKPPDEKALEKLWHDLSDDDAQRAFRAVGILSAHPKQALALFQKHLRPISPDKGAAKTTKQWIADLDHTSFRVRENAVKELIRLGGYALPKLREALRKDIPLEMRLRIEDLLKKLPQWTLPPQELRHVRAVEVLEQIGSPKAREFLQALSRGEPDAILTREAQKAWARLE